MIIELYDMTDFIGLIIPRKTGVRWGNQAGGTLCSHPEEEGIFIPLRLRPYRNILEDYAGPYDRALVAAVIDEMGLLPFLCPLSRPEALFDFFPGMSAYKDSNIRMMEAWVPVIISFNSRLTTPTQLESFNDTPAILTYPNSD